MRKGKEDPDREPVRQALVLSHLFALIFSHIIRSGAETCWSFFVKP
jgi:hypothetical protein